MLKIFKIIYLLYLALQQPSRNVFLNRAYSETPRVAYTNGYETDSGLVNNNAYRSPSYSYNTTSRVYNNRNGDLVNTESSTGVANPNLHHNHSYRTIGPNTSSNRYQLLNDQSGYDTDTGLIKLRQVLDTNRRAPSRNQVPIANQSAQANSGSYYYNGANGLNRSITPSWNVSSRTIF